MQSDRVEIYLNFIFGNLILLLGRWLIKYSKKDILFKIIFYEWVLASTRSMVWQDEATLDEVETQGISKPRQ